jgi:VCBS repeat-containing protein
MRSTGKRLSLATVVVFALMAAGASPALAGVVWSESFEGGFGDWTMNGLWHDENQADPCGSQRAPYPSPVHAAYFGHAGACNFSGYQAGVLEKVAALTLPPSLPGVTAELSFMSFEQTECGGNCGWDNRWVEISVDGGGWTSIGECGQEGAWYLKTYDLTAQLGHNVRIRFLFDSGDDWYNDGFGWMVDDVAIVVTNPANTPPTAVDDAYGTTEDVPLDVAAPGVLGNDSDPDLDPIIAVLNSPVTFGLLTLNPDGSIHYEPPFGFSGPVTFTYRARDQWGDPSAPATVTINVVSTDNDPPVNTVPGAQSVLPDTPLKFSDLGGNRISVFDPDVGSDQLKIDLLVTNGTLTLSQTTGLLFGIGDGTDDPQMNFKGTMADVNAALDGMSFMPNPGYSGPALLTLDTNDQGFNGPPGPPDPKSDNDTVSITVIAPAAVWVDDDFTPATPGWGFDHFASIQSGINAVAVAGTVNVAEGKYNEAVNLNRNVTVNCSGDVGMKDGLAINSGVFNAPAGSLGIGGDMTYSGGTFNAGGGTTVFGGGGVHTLTGNVGFDGLRIGDSIRGYWKFDEGGGTFARDESGNGLNGQINGATHSPDVPPAIVFPDMSSLSFDGNDSVSVMMNSSEAPAAVAFWFKTLCAGCGMYMVHDGGGANDRNIYLAGGNVCARLWSEETICTSFANLADDSWHHLVHTWGGAMGGQRVFIDGVERASGAKAQSDFNWDNQIIFGYTYIAANEFFMGLMDDLRVYDRELRVDEIVSLASGDHGDRLVVAASTITVGGNLALGASTLEMPAGVSDLDVDGDWVNRGGWFMAGAGTVTLTGGDQTVLGDNTFNDFVKNVATAATLFFETGRLQTVLGLMDLKGAAANLLSLRTAGPGPEWFIDPQGARAISFLDVQNSHNVNAAVIDAKGTSSVNSGNNTWWDFDGNDAPSLGWIGDRVVDEKVLITFTATATDPDLPAQGLTFSLDPGAPAGAAIDPVTGVFTWTPVEDQGPIVHSITIRVTDDGVPPVSDSETIQITVNEVNEAPVLGAIGNKTVDEHALLSFTATTNDPDLPANTLTWSLDPGAPPGASINPSTGEFTWTPSEAQGGATYNVTIRVRDDGAPMLEDFETIQITVNEVNDPPAVVAGTALDFDGADDFIIIPPGIDLANKSFSVEFWAKRQGLGAYHMVMTQGVGAPNQGLHIGFRDGNTFTFAFWANDLDTPAYTDNSWHHWACTYDAATRDRRIYRDGTLVANDTATAHYQGGGSLSIGDSWGGGGNNFPGPIDEVRFWDGVTLDEPTINAWKDREAAAAHPNWAGLAHYYRLNALGGTTATDERGTLHGTLTNMDPANDWVASAPVFRRAPLDVVENDPAKPVDAELFAFDPETPDMAGATIDILPYYDGEDVLEFVDQNGIAGAWNGALGVMTLSGSSSLANYQAALRSVAYRNLSDNPHADLRTVTFVLSDGTNDSLDYQRGLTIQPVNDAPVLGAIGNKSVDEETQLAFTAAATDPESNGLTFTLDLGAPAGAEIDPVSGAFTWTPAEGQGPGTYNVTVRVTDNGVPALDDFETIQITVNEVNKAPVLAAIGNKSVDEETQLAFTASASDDDVPGNTLSFSLDAGAPLGATIDPSTGEFTWTPAENQGAGTFNVTVRVTDNGVPALDDFETIQITVNEVNVAPVLAAIGDKTVDEETQLAFTASATDADLPANTLIFSLDPGAPAGATINSSTGEFTWTPTEAQGFGVHSVTIRVTDNGSPAKDDFETIQITVNEVNKNPSIFLPGTPLFYTEDQGPAVIDAGATVDDPDMLDFAGGTLTVSIVAGGETGDVLAIRHTGFGAGEIGLSGSFRDVVNYEGTMIGLATGGTGGVPLVVNLNMQSNAESVRALARAITYELVSEKPANGPKTLRFVLTDGDGGSSLPADKSALVTPENDNPVLLLSYLPPPFLDFDGATDATGDYVAVPDDAALQVLKDITVESTVRWNGDMGYRVAVSKPRQDDGGVGTGWSLGVLDGAPAFSVNGPGMNEVVVAPTPLNPGDWNSIAGSFDGRYLKIYVAGSLENVLDTGLETVINQGPTSLLIGKEFTTGLLDRSFPGAIREVRVWNDVRAEAELAANMSMPLTGTEAGLVGYWRLDEARGDIVHNLTGIGPAIDGVLGGGNGDNKPVWAPPFGPIAYTENDPPVVIQPVAIGADFDDDGADDFDAPFDTGTLTVTVVAGGDAGDRLSIENQGSGPGQIEVSGNEVKYEGVIIGTFSGGVGAGDPLVVTFNDAADNDSVTPLVRAILYENVSDNPSTALRTIEMVLTDGQGGTSTPILRDVDMTAVNDAPAGVADSYETDEDVNLVVAALGGVLDNDNDAENDTLTAALVTDVSHGQLVLNSDGSFTYDPDDDWNGVDTFTYRANDGDLDSGDTTVTITVNAVNDAPVLGAVGNQAVNEGAELTFTATASDIDLPAQTLTFSLVGAPGAASIDPQTGAFSWTPAEADGPAVVTFFVRVTDDGTPAQYDEEQIQVTVGEANEAPVLAAVGNRTVDEEVTLSFFAVATDADLPANALGFSLDPGAPAGASINSTTGEFTWTPAETQGGSVYSVTIRVADNGNPSLNDFEIIQITVNDVNDAPALAAIGNKSVNEGSALTFTASASDDDVPANILTYSLDVGAPAGATIDPSTGAFAWTPTEAQGPGTYPMTVRVTDNGIPARSDFETIQVTVGEVNAAPMLAVVGNKMVDEEASLAFAATATDADLPANTLAFSLDAGAPAGASINTSTGAFTWTPTESQGGSTYPVTIRVTDNGNPASSDFETIQIAVAEVNKAPVLAAIGNKTVDEEVLLTFAATATDADLPANTLTFSLDSGAPAGAAIDPQSGVFNWTPTEGQGGVHTVTVRVADNGSPAQSDFETIVITVAEVNRAPVLASIGNKTATEETLLAFTATATDPDLPANTLTFSLEAGAPAGAAIDPVTGAFTWTPTNAQAAADHQITVKVADQGGLSDTETITVTVTNVNDAPAITSTAVTTATEEVAYAYQATASDDDLQNPSGEVLTWSLFVSPSAMTIDTATGLIGWTPTNDDAGKTIDVTVRVMDKAGATADQPFQIVVGNVNDAPVITSTPVTTATEDEAYSYQVTATDADPTNDTITFALSAKPDGMTIDAQTGLIAWTPTNAQVGVNAVTVQASDGNGGTGEQSYNIDVAAAAGAPIANAGPDQTVDPGLVMLDGSASSDPGGLPLTYAWKQTLGEGVTLSDAAAVNPTFAAKKAGDYVFELTVDNGTKKGTPDTVTITVNNVAPTAEAGPDQQVSLAAVVTLDGSASADPNGDVLTYAWTQSAGPAAVLSDATAQKPAFTAEAAGALVFELVVSDGVNASVPDVVTIFVFDTTNKPPVADAGKDQDVKVGDTVTLDGSGSSDPEAQPLTYAWTLVGGPSAVTLSDAAAVNPAFMPDAAGVYTFALSVSDGLNVSPADEVNINVATVAGNKPPVANAGPDVMVAVGQTVTLHGEGSSDPEGDALTFAWTQTGGAAVVLDDPTAAAPTFFALAEGALEFALVVNDGTSDSAPDLVSVIVNAVGNNPPVAAAGPDQTVRVGDTVALDGSGSSDADGDALTYRWTQTGGPAVVLSDAAVVNPTFVPGEAGFVVLQLEVNDGKVWSLPDEVVVTVNATDNQFPVANAGSDQTVRANDTVALDGTGSTDADGDVLTYVWRQISGVDVELDDATAAQPKFIASAEGVLEFGLVVNDGKADSAEDVVLVAVTGTNNAPVAEALAPAEVFEGDTVTLDGSGSSDPDGDALVFLWTQTAGPQVVITGADQATATFVAAAAGDYAFTLAVTDGMLGDAAEVAVKVVKRPEPDGGMDAGDTGDAGIPDAGGDAGKPDAGVSDAGDAGAVPADGSVPGADTGAGGEESSGGGCGCATVSADGTTGGALAAILAVFALLGLALLRRHA